ncbi:hypothetical protein ACA910_020834 [Epithemia clementina (nom. ined.)]
MCTNESKTNIEESSNKDKVCEVGAMISSDSSAVEPINDPESLCGAASATPITDSSSTTAKKDGKQNDQHHDVEQAENSIVTEDDTNTSDVKDCKNVEVGEGEEKPSFKKRLLAFYHTYEFLLLILTVICLARAYPPLGAEYVAPQITASWCAVMFIFLYSGLGLKTKDFAKAFQRVDVNAFVQMFNFGFVSAVVFAGTRVLEAANILSSELSDGMVIASCLPMSINMVHVLTEAAGGDDPLAVINAAAGNMIGVFLSPVLILGYVGVTGDTQVTDVFYELTLKVLLPVVVGQIVQKTMPKFIALFNKYKECVKKAQEYALVFIVYTVFCKTFSKDAVSSFGEIFLMIAFVFLFLIFVMTVAWFTMRLLFRDYPEIRIMGLFGCTHKTIALGIPLISAVYEGSPYVGTYTLPLLIWYPMQLIVGSLLVERLRKFKKDELIRLGRVEDCESPSCSTEKEMGHSVAVTASDLESANITGHSNEIEDIKDEST